MSIIIAIGNKDVIYVATDGRCVWEDTQGNTATQDDFQKYICLPDGTCVAFAGHIQHCSPILQTLQRLALTQQKSGVEEYTAFCAAAANNLLSFDTTTNVQMLIAGKKQNGQLAIGTITYHDQKRENYVTDLPDLTLHYEVRSCLDPTETFVDRTIQFGHGAIEERVKQCIKIAATRSDLINDHIFECYVRR